MNGGLLAAAAVPAAAEVEFEIHTGYHSIYEFRGVDFGDDMAEGGIDFSTELGGGITLSGGAWYQDSDGFSGVAGSAFDELDLYIGLSKTFGKIDVSIGYTGYIFPGSQKFNSDEVYLGLATELENGIGLALTYSHDTNEIDGGYLEFEATKSFEINSCVSLDLSAGAAWSFGYNRDTKKAGTSDLDGINHYFASISLPWEFAENTTLKPYIKYIAADSDLFDELDSATPDSVDLFLGGIVLTYSF